MIEKKEIVQNAKTDFNWKEAAKWITPLLIALAVYILCAPLEPNIRKFFALTIWAVFAWVFEILPEALVAIMLSVFFILLGIAKPSVVFSPWSSSIPWLAFGGMILSIAMGKSGLAKRIAFKALSITGTSLPGIIAGLLISGLILTPLISSPSARVLLLAPIVIGIFQALDIKAGSKAATCIMLATLFAIWSPAFFILSSSEGLLAAEAAKRVTGEMISFTDYLLHMSLIAILWTVCSAFSLFIIRPEKIVLSKDSLKKNYEELGAITKDQILCIVLFSIMLVLFVTDKYHHINPAWIILLTASLFFFPGINVLQKEDLSKINFLIMVFIAGAMAIGEAANQSGATQLFTETVVPFLEGQSTSFVIIATWIIGILGNFLLTPVAIMGALFAPIVEIFHNLGINPLLGPYTLILGFNHFLFPYELAPALIAYSFGYMKLQDMVKILAFRMVLGFGFMLLIVIPYWKLINLM